MYLEILIFTKDSFSSSATSPCLQLAEKHVDTFYKAPVRAVRKKKKKVLLGGLHISVLEKEEKKKGASHHRKHTHTHGHTHVSRNIHTYRPHTHEKLHPLLSENIAPIRTERRTMKSTSPLCTVAQSVRQPDRRRSQRLTCRVQNSFFSNWRVSERDRSMRNQRRSVWSLSLKKGKRVQAGSELPQVSHR